MVTKRVKNTTGAAKNWLGQTIQDAAYYDISYVDERLWANDPDVATDVTSGDLVVNDGTSDFNVTDGLAFLQGVDASCVKGVLVDDSGIAGGRFLCFDAASSKVVYAAAVNVETFSYKDAIKEKESFYKVASRFIFRGTSAVGIPSSIKLIGWKENANGYLRIFDGTNSMQIGEVQLTQTIPTIIDLGTLGNFPAGEAIFEIQMKCDGEDDVRCASMSIYY